jgi:PAS domain S-box-containing protein
LGKGLWRLTGLACLIVLGFVLGGIELINTLEQGSIREHYTVLDTIARMKTEQLLTWRYERLADARMNSTGLIQSITNEWLKTSNPADLKNIAARMETFRENEGYHNMMLVDANGKVLISLIAKTELSEAHAIEVQQHELLEPEEKILFRQVLASKQPTLGDFYYCHTCNRTHINVGAPVVNQDNQPIAVLFLVSDPEQNVFPLLQTWPVSQGNGSFQTAEDPLNLPGPPSLFAQPLIWPGADPDAHGASLLVRKEKESVLYISPLQHPSVSPLSLRIALTHLENPAVRAVLGGSGMMQGKDCFGEEVLSDIRAVPGTPWHMVTKINLAKVLIKARLHGYALLLLLAMTIGTTAALVRLVTVSRQKTLSVALLQAERERSQTKDEIRATLYGISAGIMATDASGLVTRMNPEAERLTGWRESEALGQPLATVFHVINKETEEIVALPIQQVLDEGEIIDVSHTVLLLGRHGQRWPVTDSWSPIRNENGEITGVVLIFRDQTKKRALEEARAESAKRYSDLVDSVSDLIWETGSDFCFTFVSRKSTNLLGYHPEEIVGQFWNVLLSPDEFHTKYTDDFSKIIAARKPYNQHCQTLIRKDGSKVIFESSATPVLDKLDRFLGYRGISRDITERRLAEEEQKKLHAQLLQAQKMDIVGRLAGGVAHDFNNMLTVICSYVEMTLNDLGEQHPLYKRLFEVHLAAQHSADLTRQLLAFARKQVISPRILDLNETITGALKMLQRLIWENIQLAWNPDPELGHVQMDATQISQILANLAVNARDAINGPGHLTIATSNVVINQDGCANNLDLTPGNFALLTIRDDGCGMDQETQARIFEPFFTTKEEGKGTGLGLATVYGIVKQNKGVIDVFSEIEQGTVFRIYLPQVQSGTEVALAEGSGIEGQQGTDTILLVEDETAILELGVYILEQRGYTVLAAPSPDMALTLVNEYQGAIDLLITDVIMPEMNGRELAQEILKLRPEIKILFISGYTADMISHHGGLESDIHFLEKPFSAHRLGKKVREVIDQG